MKFFILGLLVALTSSLAHANQSFSSKLVGTYHLVGTSGYSDVADSCGQDVKINMKNSQNLVVTTNRGPALGDTVDTISFENKSCDLKAHMEKIKNENDSYDCQTATATSYDIKSYYVNDESGILTKETSKLELNTLNTNALTITNSRSDVCSIKELAMGCSPLRESAKCKYTRVSN